jgi:adenylate cyclase
MLAYFAGAVLVFERQALWLPLMMPLGLTAPLTMVAGLAARYTQVSRERDHSVKVMNLVLPPRVVKRLVGDNVELSDLRESVQGAFIYTDIQNFTQYAESVPPHEVTRTLNDYFGKMIPVVYARGADSHDTAGDGIMALWAHRSPGPSLSLRANVCKAALELAEVAERFSRARPKGDLATRIGVHYGSVEISMIGGPAHKAYRAAGDATNTVQRLQHLNKMLHTRVLLSEELINGLDRFVARDVGRFVLRGKTNPTHVYELIGSHDSVTPELLKLSQDFAAAMAAYREPGRHDEARERFGKLAALDDGPSAYYAELFARGAYYCDRAIPAG